MFTIKLLQNRLSFRDCFRKFFILFFKPILIINFYRFALQHMVDILRHVGSKKVYKNIEYPDGTLKIQLFRFFKNIPTKPKYLQNDRKLLLINCQLK